MSDVTVASTTDPQSEINRAAGVEVEEPKPQPVEGEEPEGQQEASEQQPKAPKSSYQKRIDKLVKERSTAKQEVEELKARLLKLEQNTNGSQPKVEAQPQPKEEQEAPKPVPDAYATYEEFVEALADWKSDQKIKQIRASAAEEEKKQAEAAKQKTMMDGFATRLDEARERYEDFDDVAFRDIPIFEGVKAIIIQHKNGPDLQYYLAKNPKYARELMEMPVEMAMARAGALAEQLGTEETETPTSQQPAPSDDNPPTAFTPRVAKSFSNAPAPIRPVGASSTKSSVPIDELPYDQYRKIRDQQEKARYRR